MTPDEDTTEPAPGNDERSQAWADFDKAEPETTSSPAGDEPSDASPPQDLPAGETEEPAAPDPWASAPEPLRNQWTAAQDQIRQLQHENSSHRGRLGSFQRQIDQLKRNTTAAPTQAAADEAIEDFLKSPKMAELQETYPEIAGPITDLVNRLAVRDKRVTQDLTAVHQDRQQSILATNEAALNEAQPGWLDIVTADPAAFTDWLASQPNHIREAAQRNADKITDPEEAADVVGRYRAWVEWQSAAPAATQPTATGNGHAATPSAPPPHAPSRRQAQLRGASTPRTRGPAMTATIPDDREGAWAYFERNGM